MNGWLKLHRSLQEHPRFSDPHWLSVWIYLLCNAVYEPTKKLFDGRVITLRAGQLITGRIVIAAATGIHPSTVYRLLALMKTEQQIEQQAGTRSSIVTILNWQRYQETEQQTEQQASTSRTANEQLSNTVKESKNGKNQRREEPYSTAHADAFAAFWSAYPKKVGKGAAFKAWRKLKEPTAVVLAAIKAALNWQAKSGQWCKDGGQYIPNPATYLNQRRWEDEPAELGKPDHSKGW